MEAGNVAQTGVEAAREERIGRISTLYAEITAATRAFLTALAESDRHRDWAVEGFESCAEWLAWRLGISRNTASEKVRAARALGVRTHGLGREGRTGRTGVEADGPLGGAGARTGAP